MRPIGVDGVVDQVKRQAAFAERHPQVSITNPRQNGTREFVATWEEPRGDGRPPERREVRRTELRRLLDYLEAEFGR